MCDVAIAQSRQENKTNLVGFSQCTSDDAWRKTMETEMQNELLYYPSLKLIIKDAKNNSKKQVNDIRELISAGIDILIVSPNESEPLTAIVSEVYRKGIPVIVIDRRVETGDYTAFIGANNYLIGKEAGKYAVRLLNGKGRIVEIWGLQGSSPARDRHKGFIEEIRKFPEIKIVSSLSGEWEYKGGEMVMNKVMETGEPFDLVYAHNDFMALGAYKAYIEKYKTKRAFFIGVDGLSGPEGGSQAVMDRKLDATLLYPTGGSLAISLSWEILNGKPVSKENELNTLVIDSTNVRALKYQADEILNLHTRIVSSRQILDEQVKRFYSQQFWLILALCSLLVVLVLVGLLFRAFRNKARANRMLEQQKLEITHKNEELIRISNELEEATKAKLVFFTNISHEFRTPLTLILGPLENILQTKNLSADLKAQLEMMIRNAQRLLRLINQLMDLRKIDNEKMFLQAGYYDMISFTQNIKEAFNELAGQKNIDFTFTSEVKEQMIYFDRDKVDKILFNLLSNAFKFTSSSGTVEIIIRKVMHRFYGSEKEALEIEIRDNGPGISEKNIGRIFERFYQADEQQGNIYPGTGIGLPLSKSFIELHKGDISVSSKPGSGTSFFIHFQLGKDHLSESEIITIDTEYERIGRNIVDEVTENDEAEGTGSGGADRDIYSDKPLLMIVEDNVDVARFIKSCLADDYRVMTASNGIEGFEKMYIEEPDLIICDVMMPGMNGLEFTRKLKSDIRTCHIPVILLTALSTHEQKIEGLETGADSYIAKPFNKKHLQVRVKLLIESRQKIRRHYQQDILSQFTSDSKISKLDQDFLKKCSAIIEKHITETEYGVEQLSVEVSLSRVHVYRKIKHLTGLSVSEFIRNLKLKKAAAMLSESGKSVAEIAYETGFSSPSYFSKCFKDLFNLTPSEYLQNNGQ
jgi:signal transduction histidine kinase/DNA-binding response OmpR family regulator